MYIHVGDLRMCEESIYTAGICSCFLYILQKDTTELKKKEGLKCSFLVYGKSVLVGGKESAWRVAIYLCINVWDHMHALEILPRTCFPSSSLSSTHAITSTSSSTL